MINHFSELNSILDKDTFIVAMIYGKINMEFINQFISDIYHKLNKN
jgi:hypothetical protein